jgi:hypothetical protein
MWDGERDGNRLVCVLRSSSANADRLARCQLAGNALALRRASAEVLAITIVARKLPLTCSDDDHCSRPYR